MSEDIALGPDISTEAARSALVDRVVRARWLAQAACHADLCDANCYVSQHRSRFAMAEVLTRYRHACSKLAATLVAMLFALCLQRAGEAGGGTGGGVLRTEHNLVEDLADSPGHFLDPPLGLALRRQSPFLLAMLGEYSPVIRDVDEEVHPALECDNPRSLTRRRHITCINVSTSR